MEDDANTLKLILGMGDYMKNNCFSCDHCSYIGNGESICELEVGEGPTIDLLTDGWNITEHYFYCNGKDWEPIS